MKLTVTEALAELKTIAKRITAKRQFIATHLIRPEMVRDPLEKDGGSVVAISRESQAIGDLETRIVAIRTAIQRANHATPVTVDGETKMLADWLTWRKEVAPGIQSFYAQMSSGIAAQKKQWAARPQQANSPATPENLLVNWDEAALGKSIEKTETILGQLDGQLSLKNATTLIEIAD